MTMDRLHSLQLFTRIVEGGSFAGAADALGMARSTASEAMKRLEADLGTRLLARTTRHVAPTPEGEEFYHRARAILGEVEDAFDTFRDSAPRGPLRIDAPGILTRSFLVPHLPEFLSRYPDITLQFGQTDRLVDLVREGVDCALRAGEPQDSGLIRRHLCALPEITCASPDYLARHGTPRNIDDLEGHRVVGFLSSRTGQAMPLEFVRNGAVETRTLPATVTADNSDTVAALAMMGLGLVQAPGYRFREALAQGTLVEVLADTPPVPLSINALYPQNRQVPRRLRVFLDWVGEIFAKSL